MREKKFEKDSSKNKTAYNIFRKNNFMKSGKTKIFFYILFLSLTTIQCNKFWKSDSPPPHTPPPNPTPSLSQQFLLLEECQFHKTLSLIIDCYKKSNFPVLPKYKDEAASVCIRKAFSAVRGTNFTPSGWLYKQPDNQFMQWFVSWGNIRAGNLNPSPLRPLEVSFLYRFRNFTDSHLNTDCLGGVHPPQAPTNLSILESDALLNCSKDQLEEYRIEKACPL